MSLGSRTPDGRPRRRRAVGWLGMALPSGVVLGLVAGCGGPPAPLGNPDPGGRIMQAVSTAQVAVPSDARVLRHQRTAPQWDSCDGRPNTYTWTDGFIEVLFATTEPPTRVIAMADARLRRAGWTRSETGPRHARWTRPAPAGNAHALLTLSEPESAGASRWDLMADAPARGELPPGRQGC